MSRLSYKWLKPGVWAVCLVWLMVFLPVLAIAQKQELDRENIERIQQRRGLYYDGKKPEAKEVEAPPFRGTGLNPESESSIEKVINVLLYSILLLGVGYALYYMGLHYKWFRASPRVSQPILTVENLEDIDTEALQEAFAGALANEQTEQVIRLGYVLCLKWLHEKRYLRWRRDKTNQTYLSELYQTPHYAHFRSVTQLFNDCVYGKYPVGPEQAALMVASVENIRNSEMWQA